MYSAFRSLRYSAISFLDRAMYLGSLFTLFALSKIEIEPRNRHFLEQKIRRHVTSTNRRGRVGLMWKLRFGLQMCSFLNHFLTMRTHLNVS